MHERSFLVHAIVYLAAAVVCVPLASRFRLGSVLGYLAAGCLIGPFGLALVSDVDAILHFSELGVVLMLFLIGLELEPARLKAMRGAVFGGGTVQMLACGAPLVLAARAVGLPWGGAIVAGLALALSSTAIAVQTMRERGLLGAPLGKTAFGVLLFQDLAAIPLVGLVPLLSDDRGSHGGSAGLALAKVVVAVAAVVVAGRFLTRPVLRAIARTNLREVFTAFALLLVLGIAEVMELAGVSMALGAFLAGALLASSEYRHALETDIEPFKGLLMGLFFIAVGMSIDFGLLASEPVRLALLVAGFVAIKTVALVAAAGPIGVARGERPLFAALLSQGGEFAFVVFGLARAARVLPGDWDKALTLAVALSMALTPLLVLAAEMLRRRVEAGAAREADPIEAEDAPVLIAGFGRFGQIVGRLLFASGLKATVLDHDPDQIEMLRRFGFRVFYGDATRLDLLHAAGAGSARVIVNAIDDVESNLRLVDLVRSHFPQLAIVARARNVAHLYELERRGVTIIERELFESSLLAGRHALELLGVRPFEARERADKFRRHNEAMLTVLGADGGGDDSQRRARVREARGELERQFQKDVEELDRREGADWHRDDER
ncbi:MAG: glutathione-regulated potassium-efflux system protein KefC [Deltaproteobacteria bacterium]|nr:glutathione-regulated potassium-efflux system protein KefC [Deltaproteobacteria bacterium]